MDLHWGLVLPERNEVSHMANESRPCPCDIGDRFDYGGRGQEVQVEHIKAYVCKPPASTEKAVIVIHDIFGWELPNTRYIADMLTTNGYISPPSVPLSVIHSNHVMSPFLHL
ncbi:carboxymethylenebutenolidase homolog, transcript variant X1 [Columba livia]|uniref:Carboxymethylenebutenolidase homolog n=1 Tax=Columba livia TaxID=8932 RepID=A0A2I0MWB0_COLLI|nr:carboxymethylenebutenolidase homolog, transcript variant X1 [Columba livia]